MRIDLDMTIRDVVENLALQQSSGPRTVLRIGGRDFLVARHQLGMLVDFLRVVETAQRTPATPSEIAAAGNASRRAVSRLAAERPTAD